MHIDDFDSKEYNLADISNISEVQVNKCSIEKDLQLAIIQLMVQIISRKKKHCNNLKMQQP